MASSVSRLGAILSPFVSVALVRSGFTPLAEALLATACLAAAAAAVLLPIETQGRALLVRPRALRVLCRKDFMRVSVRVIVRVYSRVAMNLYQHSCRGFMFDMSSYIVMNPLQPSDSGHQVS